jgi:hypothetical protein
MAIDNEGSGLPEVHFHRRTTKVNLGVAAGVVLFLAAMGAVVTWFPLHH